jgi:hypothetical protein
VQHRQRGAGGRRPAQQPAPGDFVVPQPSHEPLLKQVLDEPKSTLDE